MRIYRMTATFGKLEHETLTLVPGMNIITAPNEWGKSTWCAFLLAMLYGLDTRGKTTKTALADKERYAPWSGSPMSGRIDLRWQGKDITIERTTKGRIPMGEFRAYETETGVTVSQLNSRNCGEMLLGVEQTVFRRAGFIRLSDLPVTQDDALRRRLNALVTTGDESGDGERLARELKELKNRCRYNRTGLLPQAEGEREMLEGKLQELDGLEQQCRKLEARIGEAKSGIRELENHKAALEYAQAETGARHLEDAREAWNQAELNLAELETDFSTLPSREEAEEKLRQLKIFREQWDSAQMEAGILPELPQPPEPEEPFRGLTEEETMEMVRKDILAYEDCWDTPVLWIFWILGTIGAAAAACLFFMADWPYGLIALSIALLIFGVGLWKRNSMLQQVRYYEEKYGSDHPDQWMNLVRCHEKALKLYRKGLLEYQQARGDLDSRLAVLEKQKESLCGAQTPEETTEFWQNILHRWEEYHRIRREVQRTENHYRMLQDMAKPVRCPDMEDNMTYSAQETDRLLTDAREELQRLSSRLGQYQGRMETLGRREELQKQLTQTANRIVQLEQTYAALSLALETLAEAKLELQRRFAPRISGRARELLAEMTEGRYDRLTLSEDFSLLAGTGEENALQSILWRSDGTVDQLYLALRLAVAEELTPGAPLVLDDALVRFDDTRLKAALKILKDISRDKQVILFTCQSREKEMQ